MFKKQSSYLHLLFVFTLLTSCASSKKIIDEYIEPEKRFLGYVISSKKNDDFLNFYIVNNTTKEYIEYYFYKDSCTHIEKEMPSPIEKGRKRTFILFTFVFENEISVDSVLSNNDKLVLTKTKEVYDSLKWCNYFDPNLVRGTKVKSIIK